MIEELFIAFARDEQVVSTNISHSGLNRFTKPGEHTGEIVDYVFGSSIGWKIPDRRVHFGMADVHKR